MSRKEHFSAAHKLYNPAWSDEENRQVFGPCANINWHGHNFELIVSVKGIPNAITGLVIDKEALSRLIKLKIIDQLDHKNLNLDVSFMKGVMTSCENLIVKIWEILKPEIEKMEPSAQLHAIRLFETPRNFVDYFGER